MLEKSIQQPIGFVHFDTPGMKNSVCEFLIESTKTGDVFRNRYVKIDSNSTQTFLGRVTEGPFFLPEEVDRKSAFAQTSILRGNKFPVVPNYYALARLEILGQWVEGRLFYTNTRPVPKSPVIPLEAAEVQKLIGLKGDLLLGRLLGYEDVKVMLDENDKKILPRNIGVFGTVGSGKSNTAQVLIEEASDHGYAVIVIDIEGEYINMDHPTQELADKLSEFGLAPSKLKDFQVFYPVAGETNRKGAKPFDLEFSSMDPAILSEVLSFTEAQERVFFELINRLNSKSDKKKKSDEDGALRFLLGNPASEGSKYTIATAIKTLYGDIIPEQKGGEKFASYTLSKKLAMLRRSKIFDEPGFDLLPVGSLLKANRVSVIDISGCDDEVRNLVIAWILRRVFELKLDRKKDTPKTLLMIEEAHTFVSRERHEEMGATLEMIRTIARRGRKRWLSLCFISQQPSHLPGEIFELCNTRIIHAIRSEHNLQVLKATGGDIAEEVWGSIPSLGIGQAVITSPQFTHPVQADIRPAKTKRELAD
jgi:DNA helicase HerA-like ATPase